MLGGGRVKCGGFLDTKAYYALPQNVAYYPMLYLKPYYATLYLKPYYTMLYLKAYYATLYPPFPPESVAYYALGQSIV